MSQVSATTNPLFSDSVDVQVPATTRRTNLDFGEGLRWARSVLGDPVATSVHAAGMSQSDLHEIEQAAVRGE